MAQFLHNVVQLTQIFSRTEDGKILNRRRNLRKLWEGTPHEQQVNKKTVILSIFCIFFEFVMLFCLIFLHWSIQNWFSASHCYLQDCLSHTVVNNWMYLPSSNLPLLAHWQQWNWKHIQQCTVKLRFYNFKWVAWFPLVLFSVIGLCPKSMKNTIKHKDAHLWFSSLSI